MRNPLSFVRRLLCVTCLVWLLGSCASERGYWSFGASRTVWGSALSALSDNDDYEDDYDEPGYARSRPRNYGIMMFYICIFTVPLAIDLALLPVTGVYDVFYVD